MIKEGDKNLKIRPLTIEEKKRFLTKFIVAENGCWEWIAALKSGYGSFWINRKGWVNRKGFLAHRISYAEAYGPFDRKKMVCHKCDNRLCVNPDHLFLGNNSLNQRDFVAKGKHHKAKQKFCKNGHEFTEKNTYFWGKRKSHRACKRCHADREIKYRKQRKKK